MSSEESWDVVKAVVVVFIIGVVIGGCGSRIRTIENERAAAAEAGVGEWQVDAKTGVTTFVYKKGGCQ